MAYELNERQQKILKILQNKGDYVTASDLSSQLSVSTKTVYRDIQKISDYHVKNYTFTKKENLGYILTPNVDVEKDEQVIFSSSKERRINLLLYLLSIAPMKTSLLKLSERYFVSQSSIIHDFKYIETKIRPYNLRLVKVNDGTYIDGHQLSINRLMSVIIESFLKQAGDPFSQYHIPKFIEEVRNNYNRLYETKKFLHEIQEEHEILLDQPFYLTLFCNLLSIIEKRTNYSQDFNRKDSFKSMDKQSKAYHMTANLVGKVEHFYSIKLEYCEFNKLYYILKAYKLTSKFLLNKDTEDLMNEKVKLFSKQLVKKVSEEIGHNLEEEELLRDQLTYHLHSMVYRLNHDIYIVNPILESIKTNFRDTFQMVKHCMNQVNKERKFVKILSDEEIGYVTLYFQISIEDRLSKKIPILIECTSGIGTSHLLSEKIKKTFPNIEIKRIVAQHRLKKCDYDDVELVISTVKTHSIIDKPTILVSPILNDEDKMKIDQFVGHYYKKQKVEVI
ncbi:BglG family transcription antiterminator [Neobacillus sp. NPDC097160]|uniref:BglG family transcription antiterminator n=1 Tax=Neobacillus sp. NPDC097160 TaxID=3364298 RepID=UPI0038213849